MIICPGGAYWVLAEHEGAPVARWLNSLGIAAFVLKYRHAPGYHYPAPQQDAARALQYVRAHATAWSLDGKRIGIMGFSAGGHVAATAATHFDEAGQPASPDPVARVSSKPNLLVLVYPVITMGRFTNSFSKTNLLGAFAAPGLVQLLSDETQVRPDTPPTFLVQAVDDPVPVENSLLFARALRQNGVPFEMHLYEKGGHGYGLAPHIPVLSGWPALCAAWLRLHGFSR